MKTKLPKLPIHTVLPDIHYGLNKHQSIVLAAETGSGKTTIVPLVLIDEPWLRGKKIIMLEPRRLAARMAAKRMSDLNGDPIGNTIGYRIRFDKKVSGNTKIEVVTEGTFIRIIQNDPELANIGLVIFDEFHLRSVQSDLALALCLDIQQLRDDLKIMIMSASMDSSRVAEILGGVPVISGKGRCFPVTTHYLRRSSSDYPVQRAVKAIHHSLAQDTGDILVFLPGAGEIEAVQRQITGDVLCLPLYGNLPQEKQDRIFAVTAKRKVILATPIAETSLTIEGITVVIDSGLMKVPQFSPTSGLTALHTVPISKASAEQRAGRAGRLGPGICYRLWLESEHHSKADFLAPEIIGADLAPLMLQLLLWGVSDPEELHWLDPPREGAVLQARELLIQLGIIDLKGTLTDIGKKAGALPLHPRLALMLLYGKQQGHGALACRLAALLHNRDLFRGGSAHQSADIEFRLDILDLFEKEGATMVRARGADPSLCRRVLQEALQYQHILKIHDKEETKSHFHESGNILAIAYPDRIAMRTTRTSQHLLASGRGAILPEGDHLHRADFLVAAHLDGGKKQGRIFLAAALTLEEIIFSNGHLLTNEERVEWTGSRVECQSVLSLGSLTIKKEALVNVSSERILHCLTEGIRQSGLHCLNWQQKSRDLQTKIQTAHEFAPDQWPDVSDQTLAEDLSWLEPYIGSLTSLKQLKKIDLHTILLSRLSWIKQQKLDELFPSHYSAPSGSRIKIQYSPGEAPVLAVRIQEMFGATETPTIFDGKIPVTIHLLSPARRPVQVTGDLASFWKNTYPEVKKELAGRYPKHYWPDNPLLAQATARCKPRR